MSGMSQKTFFIIPGFKEQATDKNYAWLFSFLKTKNYKVVPVPVVWSYKTLSSNAAELEIFFRKYFEKNKSEDNYILGFSYGAILALLKAEEIKPKKLFLCSLSPHFLEDIKYISLDVKKYIGQRRLADMKNRSGEIIAKSLSVPAVVFYGEEEEKNYPALKKRCEETVQLAKNAKLVVVKNSPHEINFPSYQQAIEEEIGRL